MYIRSQDGKILVSLCRLKIEEAISGGKFYIFHDGLEADHPRVVVAVYSSFETAQGVLDSVMEAINYGSKVIRLP